MHQSLRSGVNLERDQHLQWSLMHNAQHLTQLPNPSQSSAGTLIHTGPRPQFAMGATEVLEKLYVTTLAVEFARKTSIPENIPLLLVVHLFPSSN